MGNIRSMTGYGQGTAQAGPLLVSVEVRGVNHRFADIRLRLPSEMAAREGELRRLVRKRVQRGRVEVAVSLDRSEAGGEFRLNRPLAEAITSAAHALREEYGVQGELDLRSVLSVPGILQPPISGPSALDAAEWDALSRALDGALEAFDRDRAREGEALREDLTRRIGRMAGLAESMEKAAGVLPRLLREKLEERLQSLGGGIELDPQRLAQEAVFLVERSDVTEELVRLRAHLTQAASLLGEPDGGPVGKRMDFLLQEIHREINTVNSKCSDLPTSRIAMELKVEAEKVREQLQNLE